MAYPPPGPYAPPPGGHPGGYRPVGPAAPTSGRATASIVLGALSLMGCLGFVTGIPAIIVGLSARREIRESQGRLGGDAVALGGILAGVAGTVLSVLAIVAFLVLVVLGARIHIDDPDPGSGAGVTTSRPLPTTPG